MIYNVVLLHTHMLKFYWKLTRFFLKRVCQEKNIERIKISESDFELRNLITSKCYHRDRHRCNKRKMINSRGIYYCNSSYQIKKNNDQTFFHILLLPNTQVMILQNNSLYKFIIYDEKTHYNNRIHDSKSSYYARWGWISNSASICNINLCIFLIYGNINKINKRISLKIFLIGIRENFILKFNGPIQISVYSYFQNNFYQEDFYE